MRKLLISKFKIREEIINSLKRDKILNPSDAKLIGDFIKKIQFEINNVNEKSNFF